MARVISRHPLRFNSEPQSISLQRRARILCVAPGEKGPELHVECEQDDTTKALDVSHSRQFVVLDPGASAPAGSCYIGSCATGRKGAVHVYELSGVKPQGL